LVKIEKNVANKRNIPILLFPFTNAIIPKIRTSNMPINSVISNNGLRFRNIPPKAKVSPNPMIIRRVLVEKTFLKTRAYIPKKRNIMPIEEPMFFKEFVPYIGFVEPSKVKG
jgi:hypothetical protein